MSKATKSKSHWFYKRLSDSNYRLTRPRQAILNILNRTSRHLSAEDIYIGVHRAYSNVGLATIYRNLELLAQMGLVLKFDFGDKKSRYELTRDPEKIHHHHLICKNCNKVIDYSESIDDEKEFLKRREKNLAKEYDFKIEGHFIDFFGLCNKCKAKK